MMMWIVLGIVAYVAIACVTFIACSEDGFFAGVLAAIAWPVLVLFAAVASIITAAACIVTYGFYIVRGIFKGHKRVWKG